MTKTYYSLVLIFIICTASFAQKRLIQSEVPIFKKADVPAVKSNTKLKSSASTPTGGQMTFQGALFDNGKSFTGTVRLDFAIGTDSTGWSETFQSVEVVNGLYTVVLGSTNPLPSDLFADAKERILNIQVNQVALGSVSLYAPLGSASSKDEITVEDASGNVLGTLSVVNFVDSLGNQTDASGNLDITNIAGSTASLGSDNLTFFDTAGSDKSSLSQNVLRFTNDGPFATTYGKNRIQSVAYDSLNNLSSYFIQGFGGINSSNPYLYMVSLQESGVAWTDFGIREGGGYLELHGDESANVQLGAKSWKGSNDQGLPYLDMIGSKQIQVITDSLGNPSDTSYVNYNLVSMDVTKWDNGTELGSLILSSTDGASFGINAYGFTGVLDGEVASRGGFKTIDNGAMGLWNSTSPRPAGQGSGDWNILMTNNWLNGDADDYLKNGLFTLFGVRDDTGGEGRVAAIAARGNTNEELYGYFELNAGGARRNIEMGAKAWEGPAGNELPYLAMRGFDDRTDIQTDSLGNPTDTAVYQPDLVWMEVQKWDDGNEVGALSLRSSDGTEFNINAYGLANANDYRAVRFTATTPDGRDIANLYGSNNGGGQLSIGGYKTDGNGQETFGGGASIGNKFWEGETQAGYLHLRGGVNNANYYGANMKWALESERNQFGEQAAVLRMHSPELDGNADAKVVLGMRAISDNGTNYAMEMTSEGSNSSNWVLGAKTWEGQYGADLPYFAMRGYDTQTNINTDSLGNPTDTATFQPEMVWMNVEKWDDGTEIGAMNINGSNGFETRIDNSIVQVKNSAGNGTYTQQRSDVFRVKNDNDAASSVYLNRFDNQVDGGGHARLQLLGHDGSGAPNGAVYLGSNHDGGYLIFVGQDNQPRFHDRINPDNDLPESNLYGTYDIQGSINTDSLGNVTDTTFYRPELVSTKVDRDGSNVEQGRIFLNSTEGDKMDIFATGINAGADPYTHGYVINMDSMAGPLMEMYNGGAQTIYIDGNGGNFTATGTITTTTLTQTSDERSKRNIEPLQDALEGISKMRGVTYQWKDESKDQRRQIGLIAQEVEKIYPEFVHTDEQGMKSVNYAQMTAVLIEAVKALSTEMATLQAENETLKAEVSEAATLNERIDTIEKLLELKVGSVTSSAKQ